MCEHDVLDANIPGGFGTLLKEGTSLQFPIAIVSSLAPGLELFVEHVVDADGEGCSTGMRRVN